MRKGVDPLGIGGTISLGGIVSSVMVKRAAMLIKWLRIALKTA
jgi:hypothetical protein